MNFGDCYNCYEGLHGKQLDDKVTFSLSLHIMLAATMVILSLHIMLAATMVILTLHLMLATTMVI